MKSNSSSASDSFEDNLNITDRIVKKKAKILLLRKV